MKMITAKFSLEEHQRIKIAAACVGAKLSTIVRNNLLRWAEEVENSSFHPGYRGEAVEADSGPTETDDSPSIATLEAELMRIDGVDEISGVYVEEFGYIEPGDPEYPEALRAYVENHRKGLENEPEQAETAENESPTPEDPDADFGFPDEEPAATTEGEVDIQAGGYVSPATEDSEPTTPDSEPEAEQEPEPETSPD